jgi:hypothetical protein
MRGRTLTKAPSCERRFIEAMRNSESTM